MRVVAVGRAVKPRKTEIGNLNWQGLVKGNKTIGRYLYPTRAVHQQVVRLEILNVSVVSR